MRKPDFCILENKGADRFRCIDAMIPLLPKSETFKPLAIFSGCTAQFVWDLVGNPEYNMPRDVVHMVFL